MVRARFFLIFCTLAFGCLLNSQVGEAKAKLTPEKYVRQQVAKGEWADLKERFGKKEENRRLSSRFLVDLLTGTYKVHWTGIMIRSAVTNESLNLEGARISQSVLLVDCHFKGPVYFLDGVFEQELDISGSRFDKEVDFQRLVVKKHLICANSTFWGPVNLVGADIGGPLEADGAEFLNKEHTAHFNSLKVGNHTSFNNVTFQGPVEFSWANISGAFESNGAWFLNTASFNDLKVGHTAFFEDTIFGGLVDFVGADISGSFEAKGAKFFNEMHTAHFNSLKVGNHANFNNATFQGPVEFSFANISGAFESNSAWFLNMASFNDLNVGHTAFFQDAVFLERVYFERADIGGPLEANGAKFLSKEHTAHFNSLKVEEYAEFGNATFQGRVEFSFGNISESFDATKANFLNQAIFNDLKVGHTAFFEDTIFGGPVNFRNAKIEKLEFNRVQWLKRKTNLEIDGLAYNSLCVDDLHNFPGLLGLVERAVFNPQNYLELEKYCTRAGHQDWADDVFIAMKDRELKRINWSSGWGWLTWIKNMFVWIFWGWLAGYGRQPFRTFGLSLLIIFVGTIFMFDPKYLKVDFIRTWNLKYYKLSMWHPFINGNYYKIKNLGKLYVLRFITSFDQFIPLIDLELAKNWQPPDLSFRAWFFLYFQKISGWILVSIGLAALISQFK